MPFHSCNINRAPFVQPVIVFYYIQFVSNGPVQFRMFGIIKRLIIFRCRYALYYFQFFSTLLSNVRSAVAVCYGFF